VLGLLEHKTKLEQIYVDHATSAGMHACAAPSLAQVLECRQAIPDQSEQQQLQHQSRPLQHRSDRSCRPNTAVSSRSRIKEECRVSSACKQREKDGKQPAGMIHTLFFTSTSAPIFMR